MFYVNKIKMPVKRDLLDDDFQIFNYTSNDYEKIMGITPVTKKARVVKPLPPGKQARVVIPDKPKNNTVVKTLIQNKNPILAEYSKKKGCEGSKLYNPSTKRCVHFTTSTGKSVSMALNKIRYDLFKSEKKLSVEEKQLLFQKFDDYKEKKKVKTFLGKKKINNLKTNFTNETKNKRL